MENITKEEFQAWCKDKVTTAVFRGVYERAEEIKAILAVSAGLDPLQDRFHAGMHRAFIELTEVQLDADTSTPDAQDSN